MAVCEMHFDDHDSLKAAMRSDEMAAAGKNLGEIAPDLLTLVVLEEPWSK
jgi:hypothetical protein